ncbi:hypothetical protein B566_EDAN007667, partial [Ephemera danica]
MWLPLAPVFRTKQEKFVVLALSVMKRGLLDTKGEVTPPPPSSEDTCEANVISPVRELYNKNYQLKGRSNYRPGTFRWCNGGLGEQMDLTKDGVVWKDGEPDVENFNQFCVQLQKGNKAKNLYLADENCDSVASALCKLPPTNEEDCLPTCEISKILEKLNIHAIYRLRRNYGHLEVKVVATLISVGVLENSGRFPQICWRMETEPVWPSWWSWNPTGGFSLCLILGNQCLAVQNNGIKGTYIKNSNSAVPNISALEATLLTMLANSVARSNAHFQKPPMLAQPKGTAIAQKKTMVITSTSKPKEFVASRDAGPFPVGEYKSMCGNSYLFGYTKSNKARYTFFSVRLGMACKKPSELFIEASSKTILDISSKRRLPKKTRLVRRWTIDKLADQNLMNSNVTYLGEWVNECDKLYLLASDKMNFNKSTEFCKNVGMKLLTIDSKKELDCLTGLAKIVPSLGQPVDFWTTAKADGCPKKFVWCGNDVQRGKKRVNEKLWRNGEPNNFYFIEACVAIQTDRLVDVDCNTEFRAACQIHGVDDVAALNRLNEFEIEHLKETSMWFTACGLTYMLQPKKTKSEVTPPPPSPEDTCKANVISPVRELFNKNYQLKADGVVWKDGEPDAENFNQSCIQLQKGKNAENLYLTDENCDSLASALCKLPPTIKEDCLPTCEISKFLENLKLHVIYRLRQNYGHLEVEVVATPISVGVLENSGRFPPICWRMETEPVWPSWWSWNPTGGCGLCLILDTQRLAAQNNGIKALLPTPRTVKPPITVQQKPPMLAQPKGTAIAQKKTIVKTSTTKQKEFVTSKAMEGSYGNPIGAQFWTSGECGDVCHWPDGGLVDKATGKQEKCMTLFLSQERVSFERNNCNKSTVPLCMSFELHNKSGDPLCKLSSILDISSKRRLPQKTRLVRRWTVDKLADQNLLDSNETYLGEWVNECGKLYLFASDMKEKSPTPKPIECIGKCFLYNASAVTAKKLK